MARTRRDAKSGNRTTRLKLTRGKRHQSTLDWAWHCDIAGPVEGRAYGTPASKGKRRNPRIGPADGYSDADGIASFD